ncbi:choline transporter-like protein 1 [Apostichopus japonicus]|uniref:choline transporter-like protein 1 n=1 Tax=Stichopus japonicus TaxID=307972 RepID=UPI003AB5E537
MAESSRSIEDEQNIYPKLDDLHQMQNEDEIIVSESAGPLAKRSCQDVGCCLIFFAFWIGMAYISYIALTNGHPERLLLGYDSFGNICGTNNDYVENVTLSGQDMTSKPFVFSFSPVAPTVDSKPSKMICIASCPNITLVTPEQYADHEICTYDVPVEDYNVLTLASDSCPKPPVPVSFQVLNRCVPKALLDVATSFIQAEWIQTFLLDIETTWREIVYLCLISLGFSLAIMMILRFFAGVVIWLMVLLFVAGSVGGTCYMWYRWYDASQLLEGIPETERTDVENKNIRTHLIYAGAASAVTVLILLILLVMRKRIALVVALFKEAGKVIASIPLLLLQPIWTFVCTVVIVGGCGLIFSYLITSGKPIRTEDGTVQYVEDDLTHYMKYYFVFGVIWGTEFIVALGQCVTAGAVAEWYFARDKKSIDSPIWNSTVRVIRYNLGSIAYGSLVISLVMVVRLILGFIQTRLQGSQNKIAQYTLRCLQCCMWLFEKILRFINRNAYIEIAIYGHSFCKSAQRAFTVIVSNALRVAAINSVGDFLLFLGKLAVTASVVVIALEFFQNNPEVNFYPVLVALAAVFAFVVSHTCLSVYEMVIDTLFICFCEDCEKNDGVAKPYFMSRNLMNFVENARKAKRLEASRKAINQQPK